MPWIASTSSPTEQTVDPTKGYSATHSVTPALPETRVECALVVKAGELLGQGDELPAIGALGGGGDEKAQVIAHEAVRVD